MMMTAQVLTTPGGRRIPRHVASLMVALGMPAPFSTLRRDFDVTSRSPA